MKRHGYIRMCACWILLILSLGSLPNGVCADECLEMDSAMLLDPEIVNPDVEYFFSEKLKSLWIQALRRPDDELRRLAADSIANAKRRGMEGLEEATSDLVKVIVAERESPTVQCAAVRALVALEARQESKALAECSAKGNLQLAQLIEPALADWDYRPIRQRWLQRLEDPTVHRVWLQLAIDGLRTVQESEAMQPLLELVGDAHRAPNIRFVAARAAGEISRSGLVETAQQLAATGGSSGIVDRLLAGSLLLWHKDKEAIALLKDLAVDEEPTVAAQAFQCLLDLDPKLVFDIAESAIIRPDARVRLLGARALVAKGDGEAIKSLAPVMNDVNPTNRRYVAASLAEFAKQDALKDAVIQEGVAVLGGNDWRGLEQASLLLGHLDHKPVAGRCVELLDHERGEVYVTAAWVLRRLQVPKVLPQMLAKAESQYKRFVDQKIRDELDFVSSGKQCAELFQAFGQLRYREADAVMRKCVPKDLKVNTDMRGAACWALGYLYENQPDEELAAAFASRVKDLNSMPPEAAFVMRMSAIALGRMRAESALGTLRQYAELHGPDVTVGRACYWAIEQIAGEPAPPPNKVKASVRGWFLEPLNN